MSEEFQSAQEPRPVSHEAEPVSSPSHQCPPTPPEAEGGDPSRCPVDSTAPRCCPPAIPPDINTYDRLTAARFYHGELGWAVHPLYAFNRGTDKEKGKKPMHEGWRKHQASDVTAEQLGEWFAPGTNNNLGVIARPPFARVDLDSKPDGGVSVMQWLADQPELASVPRERTTGGVHLVFICRNIPAEVLGAPKVLVGHLNLAVTSELFCNGHSLVLSPSMHKSGQIYQWDVTGPIPEVSWSDLVRWFGFAMPEAKKRGRPMKERPWWAQWREDLRTLDLVTVMRELGRLGRPVANGGPRWCVRCPWEAEHSGGINEVPGSDTVIFNEAGTIPGFNCQHQHCASRGTKDVVEFAELQRPGIIAANCTAIRVWEPGSSNSEGRPRILLPAVGRPHGKFGHELGAAIAPALDLFQVGNNVVEIEVTPAASAGGVIPGQMFATLRPTTLVTSIERSVETGLLVQDEAGDWVFTPKSLSEPDARITLASNQFRAPLPRIARLLDVPVPILGEDGRLVYPAPGYDPRFSTWLDPQAPVIRSMGLEEALHWLLDELFPLPEQGGFWWNDQQARIHALARFITPMCRGLMKWRRTPLFIFDGNREGCGKDTCADVTHVVYTGRSVVGAPLSKDCDEEMRKRITSAILAGSRFFHLANLKGHVRFGSLEAATDDSGVWEDRKMGGNEILRLDNEIEFSFSANNATWEPDIDRRCRPIRLRFTQENVNGHRYRHPDIRRWLLEHRPDLLSAVVALILHWVRLGCPPGPSTFTSFVEWGRVVGGIFHVCGLGDPCLPHGDSHASGDQNTLAMRQFFNLAHTRFGNREVLKPAFQTFVQGDEDVHDLFDWIDFSYRRGLITFGKLLTKFEGRELAGITLRIQQTSRNRASYQFFQVEELAPALPRRGADGDGERGCGDVGGCFPSRNIETEQISGNEEQDELNGSHRSERESSPHIPTSPPFTLHTSAAEFAGIAVDLVDADHIALHIETYGPGRDNELTPWNGEIRLLSLQQRGEPVHIIDLRATGYDLGALKPLLEGTELIALDANADLLWLRVKCGLIPSDIRCALTGVHLLLAGSDDPGNETLDPLLNRYLGITPGPDQSLSDWELMLLSEDQFEYAARNVVHLHNLLGVLETQLEQSGLGGTWSIECELLPHVIEMEANGIGVSLQKLQEIAARESQRADEATRQLQDALCSPNLNPASTTELLAALGTAGLQLESTAKSSLRAADDGRLVPLVRTYNESSGRAQRATALATHIEVDGRIHAMFKPTGTRTGRFSSQKPNLQGVERGEVREAFTARAGFKLVSADYSQTELRGVAAIAGEPTMLAAFNAGADLHRLTAANILGKCESEVTGDDRQLAKAVNFGLIYGQSAGGLVDYAEDTYGVIMTINEAVEFREAFFRSYPRLRQWHEESHHQAEQGLTEVRTRAGRRRLIPDTADEWDGFTALVNSPVQGGAADAMKRAIVSVAARLPEDAMLVSTIHDELIIECREEDAGNVSSILDQFMTDAWSGIFPEVPIVVDVVICDNWAKNES